MFCVLKLMIYDKHFPTMLSSVYNSPIHTCMQVNFIKSETSLASVLVNNSNQHSLPRVLENFESKLDPSLEQSTSVIGSETSL